LVAVSEGIGDLSVRRKWNSQDLNAYIADPQSVQEYETLDEQQLVLEKIMLALRTSAGISEDFLKLHVDRSAMEQALKSGDLIPANIPGNLRIPESRFFISDNIVAALV
jgi:coproporphyrinogen III oxidase-like Fe-S oxidoreductase